MTIDTGSLTISTFITNDDTQEERDTDVNSFSVKMANHVRINQKRRKLRTQRTRSRRR